MSGEERVNPETQLQFAVSVLWETIADKSPLVVDTVDHSLRKLAKKHPNEVLKSAGNFCERNSKNGGEHVPVVLNIMESIAEEYIVQLDGDTIMELISLCMELMTTKVSFEPDVQLSASAVLVALGKKHAIQIMDALIVNLRPNTVPHYTIPHTMGALASANTYAVVPYLKTVLGTMIPLLSSLKTDPLKQAFAYSLECFCDGLVEYTSNLQQAPDPTLKISDFQEEIASAYEVLFSNWLHSREPKVVESVLNALSSMFPVLCAEKIRNHTVKTTQILLNLYKKHKEPLPIVKCLVAVISTAARSDGTLLEPLLAPILLMLSDLICVSPDYAQPELLRTHSEVLRCFECFAMHYSDYIVDHVLAQMKNNNDKERIKGLIVLTHLVNSSEAVVRSRLKDIVQVATGNLSENSLRVKMALMKLVVALAYKGFLNTNDETTERFILFIVKLCCKQTPSKEGDFSELSDLQLTADNTLYMLTTSVKDLDATIWDLLLKSLFKHEYYDATIIILRCLTHLSAKKPEITESQGAFVRCLAILAQPLPNFRGTFALNFLKTLKLCDTDAYRSVWDTKIPHLLKYLEQNYEHFNEKEWEDLIFDFLSLLLENVEEQSFKEVLVEKIKEQLPLYSEKINDIYRTSPKKYSEKRLLLKSLAVISCYLTNKKLTQQVLDIILDSVKPYDQQELQACAESLGICSRSNLRLVLDTLSHIRKEILHKKSHNIFKFSFMKDQRGDTELERIRFIVLASYAEICNEAPVETLLQTIESEILQFALVELSNAKDFTIRRACLKTVGAVADAMHPNRNKLHIYMQDRDTVLTNISAQMQLHSGPEYIELFPVVVPVFTSLVRLPHVLESEPRLKLLKLCFDNAFNASAIYCKFHGDGYGDLKLAPYVYSTFSKLNVLVQELLLQCLSPATLDEVVTLLEPWLTKKKVEQRLPALEALRMALQTYLDNMKFAYEGPSTFGQTGLILARIVPRCTDPNKNTRKVAIDCVCLILCIAGRYEGKMRDHDKLLSKSFLHIQEQIASDDPKLLFNLTTDLAQSIALNVPKFQLAHFVEFLIDGLLDLEASSSNGASVVLNNVVKSKGGDLQAHVSDLMGKLLDTVPKITSMKSKATTLCAIMNLATHHLKPVVHILLQQPIPLDQSSVAIWSMLATDKSMLTDIFEQLKKILKTYPFYEVQKGTEQLHIATLNTLQAMCAFHELFKSSQSQEICRKDFAELFGLLYITLASYINSSPPILNPTPDKKSASITLNRDAYKLSPFKICLDAFKIFLQNTGSVQASANLYLCTDSLLSFLDMVPKITENICSESPQSLAWLVACLGPYIRVDVDMQRVAVAAFFDSLLKCKVNGQVVLAENILEMLLDVQGDPNVIVRKLCLQGLGYAAENLTVEIVYRHCEPLLNAFMLALDYNSVDDSDVVLQAMLSFSKLLNVVTEKHLNQCQVTAAVRIKPLLQQDNAALRQASFRLLGDLANSLSGQDDAFHEQVNGNLITLLLHLCDDDPDVIKACKFALKKVGPFLDSARVNTMIQEHILEEGSLHFTQFVTDCIKVLIEDVQELCPQLVMTCLSYYKSPWMQIRANAAFLTGLLYAQLDDENRSQVFFQTVSYRLLQLVKDDSQEVRARAVEAIANLFVG